METMTKNIIVSIRFSSPEEILDKKKGDIISNPSDKELLYCGGTIKKGTTLVVCINQYKDKCDYYSNPTLKCHVLQIKTYPKGSRERCACGDFMGTVNTYATLSDTIDLCCDCVEKPPINPGDERCVIM